MFRLSVRSLVELVLTIVLGLAGLLMLVGTMDKYKAGRAFGRAMDSYAAGDIESVHDALHEAVEARPSYTAPQEAIGKLLIDDGARNPPKYAAAKDFFERLKAEEERSGERASLPVLIGLAVAELEVARTQNPASDAYQKAVAEARSRLEEACKAYPADRALGDLYVNLATVALLGGDAGECEKHLAKVREVGNISADALRVVYNLKGLLALGKALDELTKGTGDLGKSHLDAAAGEFEIVREFAPDWDVPRLNLAAVYAQGLIRGELDQTVADHYAHEILGILDRGKKSGSHLIGPIYNSLVVYSIRAGRPQDAEPFFKEAEEHGTLSWHARFNRAVARYLLLRKDRVVERDRPRYLAEARRDFEAALKSPYATRRDGFTATCALGALDAMANDLPAAIARFETAAKVAPKPNERFLRDALPRVHRTLAALYYKTGEFKKATEALEKSVGLPYQADIAAELLKQLRTPPQIERFSADLAKIVTDYDLRVNAQVVATSTAKPLGPDNVRLTLANALTSTTTPIPYRLLGAQLRAVLINLPQGRYRVELQLTDSVGLQSPADTREFDVDREPPRLVDRLPAPEATVKQLDSIQFRLEDAIGKVDLPSLSVSLRYPVGAPVGNAALISHGKYLVESGAVKVGMEATADVDCPVRRPAPPGKYFVTVRVQDALGKKTDTEWSFTLRP